MRVTHSERYTARARPVFLGVKGGKTAGLIVEDEIDVVLPPEMHVLGTVLSNATETKHFEHRLDHSRHGGTELDELEAIKAHGIVARCHHTFSAGSTGESVATGGRRMVPFPTPIVNHSAGLLLKNGF